MAEKSLNIKNPRVHALASELARLRNITVTQAVLESVERELGREKNRQRKQGLAEELLSIAKRCAAHMNKSVTSADHATMLYDEKGLPR